MSLLRQSLRLTAAALLAACASTAESRAGAGGDRTLLGAEELRAAEPGRTLYDIIRTQRPQWLARRGPSSLENEGDIVVYQDGVPVGGPAILQNVRAEIVESARFLSASEATTRFGTGHPHGAILVTTRRR